MMLQQTQVDRVVPKYLAFVRRFPDPKTLAKASLLEVLTYWQGLGYNRRARYLHETARSIVSKGGSFPTTMTELRALPGIGPYTAAAIMVFAYNAPHPLIETNVRTVFLHHFFSKQTGVSDQAVLKLVAEAMPHRRARDWYYALMDYGVYVKKVHGNQNHRSRHYKKQAPFKGSDRQLRGAIMRSLLTSSKTIPALEREVPLFYGRADIIRVLDRLQMEKLIECRGTRYGIIT
jgi:A/G-specific adenine glycosylase